MAENFELMREHAIKTNADIIIVIIVEAGMAIVVAVEETGIPIGNTVKGRNRTMVRATMLWMTSTPMTIKRM